MHTPDPVDLQAVLAAVPEAWSPRTVGTVNDYDVRVFRAQGEFTRHSHPETDEFFLVLTGSLTIRMDDGDVTLGPGEVYVVPKGTRTSRWRPRERPHSCSSRAPL